MNKQLSPHFDLRPEGTRVDTVVLHATVFETLEETTAWFLNPEAQVSAHYSVGRDGSIVQHVEEADRAWHAGASRMADGRENVNNVSIGIELVNRNDGEDPYSDSQIKALIDLLNDLFQRHDIQFIVSHAEIALPSGRKTDPRGLDMAAIRQAVDR